MKGENVESQKFLQVFNAHFKEFFIVEMNDAKTRFILRRLQEDETMVVLSPALHRMTSILQAGTHDKQFACYINHDFDNNNFKPP